MEQLRRLRGERDSQLSAARQALEALGECTGGGERSWVGRGGAGAWSWVGELSAARQALEALGK